MTVSGEPRLKRLRDLLDQLERLPASAERERMLREVRGRLVDVDTGVAPRAMMPVEDESKQVADTIPRTARVPKSVPRPPAREADRRPPVPPAERAAPVDTTSLGTDELLSLDDATPSGPEPEAHPERPAGPWTRGLRG
jgi:hypothetical protein